MTRGRGICVCVLWCVCGVCVHTDGSDGGGQLVVIEPRGECSQGRVAEAGQHAVHHHGHEAGEAPAVLHATQKAQG